MKEKNLFIIANKIKEHIIQNKKIMYVKPQDFDFLNVSPIVIGKALGFLARTEGWLEYRSKSRGIKRIYSVIRDKDGNLIDKNGNTTQSVPEKNAEQTITTIVENFEVGGDDYGRIHAIDQEQSE